MAPLRKNRSDRVFHPSQKSGREKSAFTLAEVVFALTITAFAMGAIISGYMIACRRVEWSAYSLAAQSMAMRRLEQVVSAAWIPQSGVDNLVSSNFPPSPDFLSLPTHETNAALNATNFTSITLVSTNPPLKMIQVDCVWCFNNEQLFTNTVGVYHAPNL